MHISTRMPLIMGNWKMNGSQAFIQTLMQDIQAGLVLSNPNQSSNQNSKIQVAVCPPSVYIPLVLSLVSSDIKIGAQEISLHESGAYTGEISANMLKDLGCVYTLVGHSERRQYHKETDQNVAQKALLARKQGLIPVICVGETLEERQANQTEQVISKQLKAVFDLVSPEIFKNSVIAYEPVWAIGTGLAATAEQVQDVHAFIRKKLSEYQSDLALNTQILYGGSLKPANAGEILALNDVDGGLIGGASLKAEEFLAICHSAHGV